MAITGATEETKVKLPIESQAVKIINQYNGNNDYILYYKKILKTNPYYSISNDLAKYVIKNQNVEPKIINKWVDIHSYSANELIKFFKKDIPIPKKIFINKVLVVKPKEQIHIWGKISEDEKYYYSMFLSTSAFTKYRELHEIDWKKYESRPPMEHQKVAIETLITRPKFILADDQGVGKTTSAIVAALECDFSRILIVCPATLKLNWKKEIEIYDPKSKIAIIESNRWDYGKWIIVNYDILKNFHYAPQRGVKNDDRPLSAIQISNFDLVIIDEAHRVKDAQSLRSKILNNFIFDIPNRWLLTGTPITNRVIDYYNLLKICESPIGDNWIKFVKTFCKGKQFTNRQTGRKYWVVGGSSNLNELNFYTKDIILRRLKTEILDLPDKIIRPIYLPLESTRTYQEYLDEYKQWVSDLEDAGEQVPIWNHLTHLVKIRQMLSLDKVNHTIELTKDFIEQDKKVVIFTCFTETLDCLMDAFGDEAVRLDGSTHLIDRQKAIDLFQKNKKIKVFCGNIIAAGVGITLTAGEVVIFNDLDWVPANHAQAEDRCIYKGQLVLSKNGYKPIEDINIGDYVYSGKGNLQKVINKSTHLERKKLQVNIKYFGFNQPLSVTEDHKIYVYDLINKKFMWKEAINIRPKIDCLTFPILPINKNGITTIKLNEHFETSDDFINNFGVNQKNGRKNVIPKEIKLTNDLLFAFGWYVAEGWSNNGNDNKGYNISICGNAKKEQEIVRQVINILMNTFRISTKNEYVSQKNCISCSIYSKQLAKQFIEWFGSSSYSKKFPLWVFQLNKEQIISLLNGYFKGDGYYRKNFQSSVTVSPILASQLSLLNAMLDRPISTQISNNKFIFNYTVNRNEKCKIKKIDNNILLPVSEILIKIGPKKIKKLSGTERVYDLEIENDNTFIVGSAIVHNCMRIGQKNNVNIFYPLFDDTIDVSMFQALTRKKQVINKVLGESDSSFDETMAQFVIEKLKYNQ